MRNVLLSVSCALLLSAGPAAALGTHEFGLEGGSSFPTGNFSDAANTGYNLGAVYQFNIIDRYGAGIEIKYNGWSASNDLNATAEAAYGPGSKYSFSAWQYDAFGVFNLPMGGPLMRPYAKAGLGAYDPSVKLKSPSGVSLDRSTDFGVMAGLGMDYTLSPKVKVGFEAAYHRVKNSPDDFFSASMRLIWPFTIGMSGD
jgi:opacity protein-like surface antigen